MNIQEMHNTFRTLGQKVGLQQVRAILPESIDVYLNDSIIEVTQLELINSINSYANQTGAIKAPTMSLLNTFANLFKSVIYELNVHSIGDNKKVNYYNHLNGFCEINIPTKNSNLTLTDGEYYINPLYYTGIEIGYDINDKYNLVKCRITSPDKINDLRNDWCNKITKQYPVVCILSQPIITDNIEQFGDNPKQQINIYTDTKDCIIRNINIQYIKYPNIVKFNDDLSKCINCDLSDSIHYKIVENAVNKFKQSIYGYSQPQEKEN